MRDAVDGNRVGELLRGRNGIRILPYVEINGARTVSDDFMRKLFEQMVEEGSLGQVFYQGEVKTADEFLAFMKQPANFPLIAFSFELPAAVAWLNGIGKNHAFCHHWFYRRTWGQGSKKVAEAILEYWFSWEFLDVLLGLTPEKNHRAVAFAKRLGFTVLGSVPRIAGGEAAIISYLERGNGW